MAGTAMFQCDVFVSGTLAPTSFQPPAGCIGDAAIAAAAGVDASKLDHQYEPVFAQVHGTAATAERRVVHVVRGSTATIQDFRAGCVVACTGNAAITVDLKKNGTTVLSGTISITSVLAINSLLAAGFSSTSLVQGDVLEVVVTVNAGTGVLGQGLFATLTVREDAQ